MEYSFGAIKNKVDYRDIPAMAFQPVTALPTTFFTDISLIPVMNQMALGSCVGHAIGLYLQWLDYKETGKLTLVSPRFIYAKSKNIDGYIGQGTYPRVAAKITTDIGACTEKYIPCNDSLTHEEYISIANINGEDAGTYKTKGYAFINPTLNEIKQAIINNGLVLASLEVGDFSKLPVKPGQSGLHYICIYGYDGDILHFRNSWSDQWGNKGNGYFNWVDFDGKIHDIMVITDVPNNLKPVKVISYKLGDRNDGVKILQKDLKTLGFFKYPSITGYFGEVTKAAVIAFQKSVGLLSDGIAGQTTLDAISNAIKNIDVSFGLKPLVFREAKKLIAIMEAVKEPIRIVEGFRSFEKQQEYYDQGRTKPGNIITNAKAGESLHNYGVAFDVIFTEKGYNGNWELLGKVGKALGFEWGGDFTGIVDKPHFEMKLSYTLDDFKQNKVDYNNYK